MIKSEIKNSYHQKSQKHATSKQEKIDKTKKRRSLFKTPKTKR
jgi:hypothetical protein